LRRTSYRRTCYGSAATSASNPEKLTGQNSNGYQTRI
jgi:hypothetical protein